MSHDVVDSAAANIRGPTDVVAEELSDVTGEVTVENGKAAAIGRSGVCVEATCECPFDASLALGL